MSEVVVIIGGMVVDACDMQDWVTYATSEAEYVTMVQGGETAVFTKAVLDFLQLKRAKERFDSFEDNQGVITIAKNSIYVRYHFIRESVEREVLRGQFRESSSQHARILMKPLGPEAFAIHRAFLINIPE